MNKAVQIILAFSLVALFLLSPLFLFRLFLGMSFFDGPAPTRVVECDFYSVDAIYYSPGSKQEAKRKACENKYYGYTDEMEEKVFNLGDHEFRIKDDFGFVLNSQQELADPKSFRGAAEIYIFKPITGLNGVQNAGNPSIWAKGINLKIGYVDRDVEVLQEPSWMSGEHWDRVKRDDENDITEYVRWKNTDWGGMTYIMKMHDGYALILSCTHGHGETKPDECIASRQILPRYFISYNVNWSAINDWKKFDAAVLAYIFGMMQHPGQSPQKPL